LPGEVPGRRLPSIAGLVQTCGIARTTAAARLCGRYCHNIDNGP
jgi:hypothetical protein